VERDGHRERVRSRVGNPQQLTRGRNTGFPRTGNASAFGEVEDQAGRLGEQGFEEWPAVAKLADGMSQGPEHVADRPDRNRRIEFFVKVVRCAGGKGIGRLQVKRDSDVHSRFLKRPRGADAPRGPFDLLYDHEPAVAGVANSSSILPSTGRVK